MKLLDVTLKDLLQSTRSAIILIFMFAIPILVTALFYFLFGGLGGGGNEFELPRTAVVVVNQDQGQLQMADLSGGASSGQAGLFGASGVDLSQAQSMGDVLTQLLQSDSFADLMTVSTASTEAAAREAVDNQDAGVAIILPANFSDAITGLDEQATVLMIQDPTLTIGPAVVESILRQLLDVFASAKIGTSVSVEQLAAAGVTVNQDLVQGLVNQFTSGGTGLGTGNSSALIQIEAPPGVEQGANPLGEILSLILGGMMVFFAFYTGAAAMETILTEEERGTLARLFTTPTSHRTILGGKALAVLITLVVQVTALMLFGRVVFGVNWGDPLPAVLAGLGLVLVAASSGLFLVSWLKNTRQTGIIFGGVLTVTGMLGLIPVFTAGVPNQSAAVQTVSLLVPQGWAMRGLTIAMDGGGLAELWPTLLVLLIWSLVFAFIGQYRMQRRFA